MSIAVAIATRGMIVPIKVVMQPYTADKPKIRTVVEVTPKIRNLVNGTLKPKIGGGS